MSNSAKASNTALAIATAVIMTLVPGDSVLGSADPGLKTASWEMSKATRLGYECGWQVSLRQVEVRRVRVTAYYVPRWDEYQGEKVPVPGTNLVLPKKFVDDVAIQGSGILPSGKTLAPYSSGVKFRVVEEPVGRYGLVRPFRTAAAHPELASPWSQVCIPSLGQSLLVTDSGGRLTPDGPLDVFVGSKDAYQDWMESQPSYMTILIRDREENDEHS